MKPKKQVKFSPEAEDCPTPSPYSAPLLRRNEIWWQRNEMDEFKKAARIITKSLLTGKGEVWLSTNSNIVEHNKENPYDDMKEEESDDCDEHANGSKWWCRFGHSRRGLEHLCNMDEGKSRHKNALLATKAVIDEQHRQRMTAGEINEHVLASTSRQYTSWARDLAHAAGLADQEAVLSRFSSLINSRNDYVLQSLLQRKHQRYNQNLSSVEMHAADVIGITLPQRQDDNNNEICLTSSSGLQLFNESSSTNFCRVCRKRPCKNEVHQKSSDGNHSINNGPLPFAMKKATIISV